MIREGHIAQGPKAGFFGSLTEGRRISDAREKKYFFHFDFRQRAFMDGFLPFLIKHHFGRAMGGF